MTTQPDRQPDVSAAIELPTPATIRRIEAIADSHRDGDVRLLAAAVAGACATIETLARLLPQLASFEAISLEPRPDLKPLE